MSEDRGGDWYWQPVRRRGHIPRKFYPGRRAMDRALRLLARSRFLSRAPASDPRPGPGPGGAKLLLLRPPNVVRMVSSCRPTAVAAPRWPSGLPPAGPKVPILGCVLELRCRPGAPPPPGERPGGAAAVGEIPVGLPRPRPSRAHCFAPARGGWPRNGAGVDGVKRGRRRNGTVSGGSCSASAFDGPSWIQPLWATFWGHSSAGNCS